MRDSIEVRSLAKIVAVIALITSAGILGYVLGEERGESTSSPQLPDNVSDSTTVYPNSHLSSSLSFEVYEEVNDTTEEIVQFIHIWGQVESEIPYNVTAWLRLRVSPNYVDGNPTGGGNFNYNMNAGAFYDTPYCFVSLPPLGSSSVDWTLIAVKAFPSNTNSLIREENSTFYYAFTGWYYDDEKTYRTCSILAADSTLLPDFRAEFSLLVFNEWPHEVAGGITFIEGVAYNDGLVRGSGVLRWRFNDSTCWADEYREINIEGESYANFKRIYQREWIEMDDSAIRLEHWVITLW